MKKDIGIGVIGIGYGNNIFPLNKDKNTRLRVLAICGTRSKEKAKEIMKKWDIGFYTKDYRELVNNKDIDVVCVFSPDYLHYIHCKEALKAGKHIVCTKPLTDKLKNAIKIVKLVKKTGLKFLMGQTFRYDPQVSSLRKFYEDGDIGRVIFAEAHYLHDTRSMLESTPWRLEHPQDFMYGGISHPLDVVRWFMGDIDQLHAIGTKGGLSPYPLMDNYALNLKFKNGSIGRVLGLYGVVGLFESADPLEPMMKLSIYGDRGSGVAAYTNNKGGFLDLVFDKIEYKPVAHMNFPPELRSKTVIRYMKYFEDCLINDKEPSPNVIDGAKTVSAGDAAWKSIKTGKVVKVFNEF